MSDEVQPSFAATFLARMIRGDVSDLKRPEVLLELAMSMPMLVGYAGIAFVGTRNWRKRRFLHVVNVSLNTYNPSARTAGGKFYFRTLAEMQLSELLPPVGARRLRKAAMKVTKEQPIIEMDRTAMWVTNNVIANQLSAICADAFLARDMGLPNYKSTWYVMCLTAESVQDARLHKIRAQVMKESTLKLFAEDRPEEDELMQAHFAQYPSHRPRYYLMKRIAREYVEACDPTRPLKEPPTAGLFQRIVFDPNALHVSGDVRFFRMELCSAA